MAAMELIPHRVISYTASVEATAATTGFRWSIIRWRETKEKKGKRSAVAVLVPQIELKVEKPEVLAKALQAALDGMQDNRIRSILTKMIEDDTSVNLIGQMLNPSDYEAPGIAEWMEATTGGGRLSAELIKSWFATIAKPAMLELMKEKGHMEGMAIKIANSYEATMVKLASPVTPIAPEALEKLVDLIAKVTDDENPDRVAEMLANAITKRMPRSEEEMLLDL